MGDYDRATSFLEQALQIKRSIWGEQHLANAGSLNNLAMVYQRKGDYKRAAPLYQQALAIFNSVSGEQHPNFARMLNNLAQLHGRMGEHKRAEELQKQSLAILSSIVGETHPDYAGGLQNLAVLYSSMGDYVRALPLAKQSSDILKSAAGDQHPFYIASLHNLASLYRRMGDYARAEPLHRQCVDINRSALGEQHPTYAISLHMLAWLYDDMGEYARAEQLWAEALEIRKSALGEFHPSYIDTLGNLGVVYRNLGDYDRAESLLKECLDARRQILGEQALRNTSTLNNLAELYASRGDYTRAEPVFKQTIEIEKQTLGERHPSYAISLHNLAGMYHDMGDPDRAVPLYRKSIEIQRNHLNGISIVQSARQQSQHQARLRTFLDHRLINAVAASEPAADVAEDLWQWKGSVTARQQAYRTVARNRELAPLFEELQSVTQQLSVASGQAPTRPPKNASEIEQETFDQAQRIWKERVDKLTRQREDLEQQIAARSDEFRQVRSILTTDIVRGLLPPRTAFIDFVEYTSADGTTRQATTSESRYLAIVVRADGPVKLVALGRADVIGTHIVAFRRLLTGQGRTDDAGLEAPAKLRETLWLPLEEHLGGIKTVIISPDTALGTLPFAALPGRDRDSFLIEDYRLASIPFANLLQNPTARAGNKSTRRLLVIGDVNYDAIQPLTSPNQNQRSNLDSEQRRLAATRGDQTEDWESLAGFREELDAVTGLYRQRFGSDAPVAMLSSANATEDAFLQQAATADAIHVITHGFFSDPEVQSFDQAEITGGESDSDAEGPDPFFNKWLPGLLCGLVMAGANQRQEGRASLNDGILRASEIEASSMQGVDLVVLSACETGLGAVAGGEGLTGLQRAFHIAGARTVVASLWKVDDTATRVLMERFYANLWNAEQPMTKLDALHEAQLWLLNNPVLPDGTTLRGEPRNRKQPAVDGASKRQRTDPRYWAAFVLSGDWR